MRRFFVAVVFVIYVIIGVFVASGHHYFEHLDALKHRLGSSRSAVVAPHPLRDQPAYQVGAASASDDSDKRMVCAMLKTGGTVDRVDLTDRRPDAVTAIFGLGRFLAMVKNIDHYLSQVRFPPRAASLGRGQGSHLLASSDNEQSRSGTRRSDPGALWPPQRGHRHRGSAQASRARPSPHPGRPR